MPSPSKSFSFPRLAAMAAALAIVASLASPASSQSRRELDERLERLERDLMDVQRLLYRGQVPTRSPGDPVATTSDGSNRFADIELRFQRFEEELRTLTGRVEELTFRLDQIARQMEKVSADVDFRLSALEKSGASPSEGSESSAQPSQTLSVPSASSQGRENAAAAPALPEGGAQAIYDHALGLLRAGDYAQAETAFQGLLDRHPKDALAGNAQYWLGESYYVRKQYDLAAKAFLAGYQNYPDSNKRADSLLKLGLSLKGLGQKDAACASFGELLAQFPQASKPVLDRAAAEQRDSGCR